jgi:hypothetical protein
MSRTITAKLITAKRQVTTQWQACCKHDNVAHDSKFVVFSKDNPHQAAYQRAMSKLLRLLAEHATPASRLVAGV